MAPAVGAPIDTFTRLTDILEPARDTYTRSFHIGLEAVMADIFCNEAFRRFVNRFSAFLAAIQPDRNRGRAS